MDRRQVLWVGLAGIGTVLAGCGGPEGEGATGTTPASGSALKLGMVTDTGGIGDQSFNMMAWRGLERAKQELEAETTLAESSQVSDYTPNLQRLAERGCKVIFAVGFALEKAVGEVAPRYPDTRFVLIDVEGPKLDNVAGLVFREEEGAYLAGALAGGMSRSGKLGFVGGMEIPLIKRFEAGYRAGARTLNPATTVEAKYTNNWVDVAKGKELALSLFGGGADIVFHASGACGRGVIEAAKEKGDGYWAIGVDADQDHLGTADPEHPEPPSRVLTSMMKRVDNVVFAICKESATGSFAAGPRVFGVKEEGVGLSPMTYTKEAVPAELLARVEVLRTMIADGQLKPPRSLGELETWKAPSV